MKKQEKRLSSRYSFDILEVIDGRMFRAIKSYTTKNMNQRIGNIK